MISKALNYR